jgi:hypothetical protein
MYQGGLYLHTLFKTHNSKPIYFWSLGNVYYIKNDNGEWIYESEKLADVEKYCEEMI